VCLSGGCVDIIVPPAEGTTGATEMSTSAPDHDSDGAAADPGGVDSSEGSGEAHGEAGGSTTTGGSDSAGSWTGDDTSSGSPSYCGDGRVDPDQGEECDEGLLITANCEDCRRVRVIFLTSELLKGGKINGLTGADAYCRSLALKAKDDLPESPIVEPMNFKALLSTSTESLERHHFGLGPYRLVNGLQVSANFVALFTEPLENPINVTERSETLHSLVWTGIDIDGTPYPGIDFCGDWTDVKGTANFGYSDAIDSDWIHLDIDLNPDSDCYSDQPIYCVEQE